MTRHAVLCLLSMILACGDEPSPTIKATPRVLPCMSVAQAMEPEGPIAALDTDLDSWDEGSASCGGHGWSFSFEEDVFQRTSTYTSVSVSAWDLSTGVRLADAELTHVTGYNLWRGQTSAELVPCDAPALWVAEPWVDDVPAGPEGLEDAEATGDVTMLSSGAGWGYSIEFLDPEATAVGAFFIYPHTEQVFGPFPMQRAEGGIFELKAFDAARGWLPRGAFGVVACEHSTFLGATGSAF